MAFSQSASCSSIDLAGLPARILEALSGLDAVCREPPASAPYADAFEEAELRVRESANALGCEVLGAWVERVWTTGRCGSSGPGSAGSGVPGGGDGEGHHEHARSGSLQPGALSPRREPHLARAGGRKPGTGERLPDAPGCSAQAYDDGSREETGRFSPFRHARQRMRSRAQDLNSLARGYLISPGYESLPATAMREGAQEK